MDNAKSIRRQFVPPFRSNKENESSNDKYKEKLFKVPQVTLSTEGTMNESYYSVIFSRKTTKKKGSRTDDGVVCLANRKIELQDSEGKKLAARPNSLFCKSLRPGECLSMGNFLIEVQYPISRSGYLSGRCFYRITLPIIVHPAEVARIPIQTIEIPSNALILDELNRVFVVPHLTEKLRPHQKEGVQFMYDCVSGVKGENVSGCILADAMGLGKSLQTIALLYTLLRRDSPYPRIIAKAIIVAPSALLHNWKAELRKWLDTIRFYPIVISGTKKEVENSLRIFETGQTSVLIISYESFRNYSNRLNKVCDLIVCDEGHRLKNANCLTTKSIAQLKCKRRVLLTGTPLQNSLFEFFTCADLVNPGVLGTWATFNRLYSEPILKAQEPTCSEELRELAAGRSSELSRLTSTFILRRTGGVLESLLPPRREYAVFCQLHPLQRALYTVYLTSALARTTLEQGSSSNALELITELRKITTHPDLVYNFTSKSPELLGIRSSVLDCFPVGYPRLMTCLDFSYKFLILSALFSHCTENNEKLVVVSSSTKTLNCVGTLCGVLSLAFVRLDGKTPHKTRTEIVNEFNKDPEGPVVFLLSLKAGGCGLNLIGGNRLVLIDPDWNPSNDKQAMGRIWRDGQTRPVYIYRLIAVGTIEEKIYQRQLSKQGLSSVIVDSKQTASSFSVEYLKELFTLNTHCETYPAGDTPTDDFLPKIAKFTVLVKEIHPEWVMQEELDFSQAEQGALYKADSPLEPPKRTKISKNE